MIVDTAAAFAALLPDGGRLLGLDLGTKTIGVASCDAGWSYATPGATIRRAPKFAADRAALAALVARDRVAGIVLGLPLNLDGSAGPRVQATKAFARNIENLGPPILLWDERWSTQAVERQMIAQDMSRAKRAERIDSMAAAHILQGAIDALAAVPGPSSPALPSIDAAGQGD